MRVVDRGGIRSRGIAAAAATVALKALACGAPAAEDRQSAATGNEAAAASGSPTVEADSRGVWTEYRNVIGEDSPKIRREGDSVRVWSGGAGSPDASP